MNLPFKEKLKRGTPLVGTILSLPSPEIAEILSDLGFDWLFVDTEHTPLDAGDVQSILQAAGRDFPCLVRVPAGNEVSLKKVLDTGPAGVIVPHVNSADDARRVIQFCKHPPAGSRSVGMSRGSGYGMKVQEYLDNTNEHLTVVLQIEHIDGVRNIESIVTVPGFDAVFIGPYDLSGSMGMTGRIDAPEVQREIEVVRATCSKAGLAIGIFAADGEAAKPFIDKGYTLMAIGTDTLFLAKAAQQTLSSLRE